MVFATGEGQTDPPGQDGRIIETDLRRPLLEVTAKIGGLPAEVLYAGSAPTLVSGWLQANVRIPEDIEAGTVPIEILVGGVAAQARVTIGVR
jgi:trimeric autotransporter adhesin